MFNGFSHSVMGASHEKTGLVCQDSSAFKVADDYAVAVAADGHGSRKHFRSHIGSKYAVEAIENGSAFDTYIVARLFYFMLTNSDIDDSKYKDQHIELFVDFLAGKTFRFRNYIPHKSRVVENPKACNLPLYLKE